MDRWSTYAFCIFSHMFCPHCSPVGVASRMHLICPVTVISARMLLRGPPDFEQLADEHHCPNPGR
jgi:hypothetical protein